MAKKSGRITLRVEPAVHAELAEVAGKLDMELNELLVQLIQEGLPAYRARATQKQFEETLRPLPGDKGPLVQVAVDAGRGKKGSKRIEAMIAAVEPKRKPEDGLLAAILAAALHELEKEDELKEMEEAIKRYYEREGREPPEGELTLVLWATKLGGKPEKAKSGGQPHRK